MVVQGAMMIEPTESESREELDLLIDALKQIAREAEENPELVQTAPHTTRLQRLDETAAARKPVLRWKAPVAAIRWWWIRPRRSGSYGLAMVTNSSTLSQRMWSSVEVGVVFSKERLMISCGAETGLAFIGMRPRSISGLYSVPHWPVSLLRMSCHASAVGSE